MTSILSNPQSIQTTQYEIRGEKHEVQIDFLPEKLVQVDRPLTDVVCEKEYSTRLQYTKHFPECHPHLFFREVNDRVERDDTGYGVVFKFEFKNIPLSEARSPGEWFLPVPAIFRTDPAPRFQYRDSSGIL